ncbi:MAG TPA: DUF1775 domain-containing protein [Polyangia bacterium]|nr:DUF1775 domain-containing protein [Polyangia bacterium]
MAGGLCAVPAAAHAHITVASGPGFAGTTQEIGFGVAHGCAGADTIKVRIEIPAAVTSVRPMRSDFGTVSVEKDATGAITAAVWQKADADVLDADIAYYKLVIRLKVPNQPFTTVFFPAHQTCRAADGTVSTTDWVALPTDPATDGGAGEPAPALTVLPPRAPGWNTFTVPAAIPDLGVFFSDALIVWKGTAAYSANMATQAQIAATAGVTPLSSLAAGDQISVRY